MAAAASSMNEINMVPFIDVMLVLLDHLFVTAPMLTPSSIDVLPVSVRRSPHFCHGHRRQAMATSV